MPAFKIGIIHRVVHEQLFDTTFTVDTLNQAQANALIAVKKEWFPFSLPDSEMIEHDVTIGTWDEKGTWTELLKEELPT